MLFAERERETELTNAVIQNDIKKVEELKKDSHHVLEKNSLGFNGVELARFLDRKECLQILEPPSKKTFKVKIKNDSKYSILSQEEFENLFHIKYLRSLKFETYQQFKTVVHSCLKAFKQKLEIELLTPELLKKYENSNEIFSLRGQYYKEKIYNAYTTPFTLQWINETLGYGLFADHDLKKGDYIGSYCGKIRRSAFWLLQNNYSIFYPNRGVFTYLIDGEAEGNEMRFINHSSNPNLVPLAAADRGLVHCIYLANKKIAKGEQLLWNYGKDFWASREPPQEI